MGEKRSRRGRGILTMLILAALVVVVGVGVGVGLSRFDLARQIPLVGHYLEYKPPKTTSGPVVVGAIQNLNQLATVKRRDFVFIDRQSGGNDVQRFFTGQRVRLIAVGEVQAGVDLKELRRNDIRVDDATKTVTVKLPKAKILNVSLDEKETRVYDHDYGIISRFNPTDDMSEEVRGEAVGKLRAAAQKHGILARANENARSSISTLIKALGFRKVRFE